ncbi:MAG: hypothetical protein OXU20_28620 [Myxococcales bacterium]|nr:hypothetical protein [Myxococcales bacterium]MDD9966198.1 hypothetical protein [Myxococcales bacterium]
MRKIIIVGGFLLCTSASQARPPVPTSQWTPDTHLWLSRAMVAEAGWQAETDHVAIAHVLARRWRRAVERWPTLRFIDVIRNYCAGLGDYRRTLTRRQRWLRSLDFQLSEPSGWPRAISWDHHVPLWQSALRRSHLWVQGLLRDPCGGRAWHWGGVIDSPHGRMEAVDCGETLNTFYGITPRR